jgi:hypothetical protein
MSIPKIDPASVEAAAKAMMGPSFAAVQEGLTKYKEKYEEMTQSGAESVSIVVTGKPEDKEPNAAVYVKMKPGADHAAAEKKLREAQAKEKGDDMDISNEGEFLVMRKKGVEPIKGGQADRAATFAQVGNTDKALSVVFVPTEAFRAKMKQPAGEQMPDWGKAAQQFVADSKWMKLDVALGDSPNLGVTLEAADETGAKGIADAVTKGSEQLKAQAAALQGSPQGAPIAQAFTGLAEAMKPTQNGSKVTLSVDGKVIGPAVGSMLPFMMGAAGGAGGRPAKPGGGL